MMLTPAFMLLALTSAAPLPRAAVLVHTTGLADGEAAKLEDKVSTEVASRGFEVVRIMDADPACLSARACARVLVRGAGAVALARVDLVRGGGNVQIAAILVDDDGRASDEITGIARLTALLGGDAVLPPTFLPLLAAKRPAVAVEVLAGPTAVPPTTTTPTNAPTAATPSRAVEAPTVDTKALSGVALAAIGGVGVGALAVAVGAVGATGQVGLARDPTALGVDKERAAVLVPVLVVVAVAGAALAGASGWVLVSELD